MEGVKFRCMLTEVNDVLKTHFGKMLEKVKKETSEIEQTTRILRDLPFVRALQAELEKQRVENQTLGRQNLLLLQENVTLKARMKATETERVSLEIKEIEGDDGGGAEDLSEHIYGACHGEDAAAAAAVAAAWEMVKTAPLDGSEEEEDESEEEEEEEEEEAGGRRTRPRQEEGGEERGRGGRGGGGRGRRRKEEEEGDVEVEEVEIDDKMYYTDNKENGVLYEYLPDGEIGDEVGHLENGHVFFS